MANELSRVGDRLTRARERTWNGAARLLLPVQGKQEARREPNRVPSSEDRERQRDAAAEKKRSPTTLVAIHVEVRHPPDDDAVENTARFVEARVDDVAQAHQHEFAIEDEPNAPIEPTYELDAPIEPMLALPALSGSTGTYNSKGRVGVPLHYVAARALSAYLAQRTFASTSGDETRLIDLRV